MRFVKMEGAGNDYVYVDCFQEQLPEPPEILAPKISNRHFGVGSDGLILIAPSQTGAAARMIMYNADGSQSEMCGNGVRCVAKYVYDHRISVIPQFPIETGAGVLMMDCELENGLVSRVRVNMGEPILAPEQVPTLLRSQDETSPVIDQPLEVDGKEFLVSAVSMGNPHCIIFVDEITDDLVFGYGPKIEVHPAFPRRVNVEFVQVLSETEMRLRVWERGAGETLACGTGTCASVVAAALSGRTSRHVIVHLLGGDLEIHWAGDQHLFMTGPAREVFRGEW